MIQTSYRGIHINSEPRHPCIVGAYVQVSERKGKKSKGLSSDSTIKISQKNYQHGND
jgi:hypothetical protein